MNMSDFLESSLRGHIMRGVSYTAPTVLAIALCGNIPTDASTGASMGELANAGGYARQQINPNTTNWSADSSISGVTYNNSGLTFPQASADWGWISGLCIVDSVTYGAGNVLFWGALPTPKQIQNTDQLLIPLSGVSVRFE